MQSGCPSRTNPVKRERDDQEVLGDLDLKRVKAEDEEQYAASDSFNSCKPASRGVARYQYPDDCKPTNEHYGFHRESFINEVEKALACRGKRVLTSRFLGDGVVFDWVFDKSVCKPNVVTQDSRLEPVLNDHDAGKHELEIPGLHFYNLTVAQTVAEDSTITLHDEAQEITDGVIDSRLEGRSNNEGNVTRIRRNLHTASPPPDIISKTVSEEESSASEGVHTIEDDSLISRETCKGKSISTGSDEGSSNGGISCAAEEVVRPETTNRDHVVGQSRPPVEPLDLAPTTYYSPLTEIDWPNYRAIVILKKLPRYTTIERVYELLKQHGLVFAIIKTIKLHTAGMASVQFRDSQDASRALRCLREHQQLSNDEKRSLRGSVIAVPCEAPKKYSFASGIARSTQRARGVVQAEPQPPPVVHDTTTTSISSESATDSSVEASQSASSSDDDLETSSIMQDGTDTEIAESDKQVLQLPTVRYGRPRRLLLPSSPAKHIMTVSMRQDVQFINQATRKRVSEFSIPASQEHLRVEDAAIIDDSTAVIVYRQSGVQATICSTEGQPTLMPLKERPHDGLGISCVASFMASNSLAFLTAGYDKTVKLWKSRHFPSKVDRNVFTVKEATGPLNSAVNSVAHHSASDGIFAAAGKKLWRLDLQGRRQSNAISNSIHQIHIRKNPNFIVLEVDHLFKQMLVFDIRAKFDDGPMLEFGHKDASTSSSVRSRRRRGHLNVNYFVRGYADGSVQLFDLRSSQKSLKLGTCGGPVWHTLLADKKAKAWAFAGDSTVVYFDTNLDGRV